MWRISMCILQMSTPLPWTYSKLLAHWHPMINYKSLRLLFQLLKVKNVSKKHLNFIHLGMARSCMKCCWSLPKMHSHLQTSLQIVQMKLPQSTTPNGHQHIHLICDPKMKMNPILLCLEIVGNSSTYNNIPLWQLNVYLILVAYGWMNWGGSW